MTTYEPLLASDWSLKTGDQNIDMAVKSISRPQLSKDRQFLTAAFREMSDVDVLGSLARWKSNGYRDIQLHILDTAGRVVEIWNGTDVGVAAIDTNLVELNYESNVDILISVTLVGAFIRLRVA